MPITGPTLVQVPGYEDGITFGVMVSFDYQLADSSSGNVFIYFTVNLKT